MLFFCLFFLIHRLRKAGKLWEQNVFTYFCHKESRLSTLNTGKVFLGVSRGFELN